MDYCSTIESRALKSSFISRMALKTNSQPLLDDHDIDRWCFAGVNCVAGDDFPVEDLLNLDFQTEEASFSQEEEEEEEERVSFPREHCHSSSSSVSSISGDFDELLAGELSVPTDELESLEWLSKFVDDSSPKFSSLFPAGNFAEEARDRSNQKTPVPRKSRSKRSRGTRRAWPLTSLPVSTTSSSSHDSSTSDPVQDWECFSSVEDEPPAKKKKPGPGTCSLTQAVRRCTHCLVQKTPQWRTGPLGPKTLCNACGVRFKSGRLLPEYRPACSPTFSRDVHSNSHRKVLQMRQKKEVSGLVEPGLTRMVPSF